jgi:hypothetical protein
MGAPVPFRTKKGEEFSPWKAVVNGKTVELAPNTATQEEASGKLALLIPVSIVTPIKKTLSIDSLFKTSDKIAPPVPSLSTASISSATPSEKPKTAELRKEGLSELSTAKVTAFRKIVAQQIASGNVSLDRALVSIFRDKVPILTPEQHLLLSSGWELMCEQYFVDGLPPAWVVILLGNFMVCTALYEKSEPKKEEELPTNDGSIPNGNPKHKP